MEAAEQRKRKKEEEAAKKAARDEQRSQDIAARKRADAESRLQNANERKKELAAEEASIAAMTPLPPANTSESRKCMRGMKLITRKETRTIGGRKVVQKTAYCIDYHEYPGRGKKPKVNVTWFKASSLCAAKGKRLCTSKEWKQGCGGRKYPYGKEWSASRCNTMNAAGKARALKTAGSSKKCKSGYGLYDMSGNASEWTADKTVNGGNAGQDGDSATCYRASKRSPSSASSMIGFRCCADPE